jgi:predicted Zn-dependent peptidase
MTKYSLPGGLTVILYPLESAVSLSAGLWIKTGSRHEIERQYGYAHFVEHMLFKGTKNHSAKELAQMIDRVGGQHNAATNREYTCYYVNVVSDCIDLSLHVLSDMYYNSLFDKEEMEKEKGVVLEEIGMYEDTPDELIHDIFMESMMNGHPLGHSILGFKETVSGITREKLTEFYDTHYFDENAVLCLAGRFDENAARSLVEKNFSQKRSASGNILLPSVNRARVMRRHEERDLEQVHLTLGFEAIKKDDPRRWSLYLLSTITGGSMSSRLFQRVRENEGLCYSIYSFHSSYDDNGIFGVYCGTSPEKYARAMDLIADECAKIAKGAVTAEELKDAKSFMKGSLALSLESIEVRMGQLARNEIMYGKSFTYDEMAALIDAVTLDEFNSVAEQVLLGKKGTLVTIGNVKDDRDGVVIG